MNLFARIDAWLIAGPFQTVVDISQRKPEWWAQQSLIATLVLECIRQVVFIKPSDWIAYALLFLGALCLAGMWLFTLSPALLAYAGSDRRLRAMLVVLSLFRIPVLFTAPERAVIGLVCDACYLSFFYFAACKPPRPRVPRSKLASAGGAA